MSRRLHLAQMDGVSMEASTGVSMGLGRLVEAVVRRLGPDREAHGSAMGEEEAAKKAPLRHPQPTTTRVHPMGSIIQEIPSAHDA